MELVHIKKPTCEYISVAGGHVVAEHVILQPDLVKGCLDINHNKLVQTLPYSRYYLCLELNRFSRIIWLQRFL